MCHLQSQAVKELFHPDNEGNTVVTALNVTRGEVLSTLGQLNVFYMPAAVSPLSNSCMSNSS
jgi:hypothetical protein